MKILRYVVILLILSAGVLLWKNSSAFQQPTASEKQRIKNEKIAQDYYREDIERAKAESKIEVILPAAFCIPSNVTSLEQVMRDYSLLRVEVLDKETAVYEPDADIKTWYKLAVTETLHQQDKVSQEPLLEGVPSRLLPLLPSESLWVVQGGTITVDGIRVVRALNVEEVAANPGEEYLIAADLDYGGKLIRPIAGAAGVFRINHANLKPLSKQNRQLVREVEEIYDNDLERIRSGLQLWRQSREK